MERLKYKMYALNIFQLKGIQQGIQAQHAISRYEYKYRENPEVREAYDTWIQWSETTVILNAGTTITLKNILQQLIENGIPYATFQESTLDNIITSVAVLADERVWDKIKYPDPQVVMSNPDFVGGFTADSIVRDEKGFEEILGGKKNVFLRQLLTPMRTI
jgi:hypothetical protein